MAHRARAVHSASRPAAAPPQQPLRAAHLAHSAARGLPPPALRSDTQQMSIPGANTATKTRYTPLSSDRCMPSARALGSPKCSANPQPGTRFRACRPPARRPRNRPRNSMDHYQHSQRSGRQPGRVSATGAACSSAMRLSPALPLGPRPDEAHCPCQQRQSDGAGDRPADIGDHGHWRPQAPPGTGSASAGADSRSRWQGPQLLCVFFWPTAPGSRNLSTWNNMPLAWYLKQLRWAVSAKLWNVAGPY